MVTLFAATLALGVVLFWPLPKPDDEPVLHFLLRLNNIHHEVEDNG